MRGLLVAGAVGVGYLVLCTQSVAETIQTWTYYECVQDCRDNAPESMTLHRCILERNCNRYPRPRRTYEDCVRFCDVQRALTGETLQQCVARYVCSQYPRK
jgi:hypothetical protein